MQVKEFEQLLDQVTRALTEEARKKQFTESKAFENRVRSVLVEIGKNFTKDLDLQPPSQSFPDIVLGQIGVEVKFTLNDTWRSVANSVLESTRNPDVKQIYLVFGKMGGQPEVKWAKYEDSVMHVRTSHVPRFEVEINPAESLFHKMKVTYAEFCTLPMDKKMEHIRTYARGRLRKGERLWWLEDKEDSEHTLPIQVKLYMNLSQEEKRKIRAEAVLLCPQVLQSSRTKNKYNDATMYVLTYRGILCPQMRDLFTAGSVAGKERGGNYLLRSVKDIETEILAAANYLNDALFIEYWEKSVKPHNRIAEWLKMADKYASGWIPSETLFNKL